MKISLQQVYESTSENLFVLLNNALVCELKDLLLEMEESNNKIDIKMGIKIDVEKKAQIKEKINEIIKQKQEQQINRFKKVLSPELEYFLEENFPNIENIHETVQFDAEFDDTESPISAAIKLNKVKIIQEMIDIEGSILPYMEDEEFYYALCTMKHLEPLKIMVEGLEGSKRTQFLSRLFKEYFISYSYDIRFGIRDDIEVSKKQDYIQQLLDPNVFDINLLAEDQDYQFFWQGPCLLGITSFRQNISTSIPVQDSVFKFIEFFSSHIKEKYLKNAKLEKDSTPENEVTNAVMEKKIISLLNNMLECLITNLGTRGSSTLDPIEEQLLRLNLQIILKLYNFSSENIQKACQETLTRGFYRLRSTYTDGKLTAEEKIIDLLEFLLDNFGKNLDDEILEFVLESNALPDNAIIKASEYCLKKYNSSALKFLLSYYPLPIISTFKKLILDEIANDSGNKFAIFALQFARDFNNEEMKIIDAFIARQQKLSVENHLVNRLVQVSRLQKGEVSQLQYDLHCEINDSLFGHIHNDHMLTGTYQLQGNQFSNTLKYLYRFLSEAVSERVSISSLYDADNGSRKACLDALDYIRSKQILPAIEISLKIERHRPHTLAHIDQMCEADNIEEVTQFILHQLMRQDGNLLIPGGYIGLNGQPGHAMLYEFKRSREQWLFIIRNTGDGLDLHPSLENEEGTRYSCKITFEMPFSAALIKEYAEVLQGFIRRLITPCMTPAWGVKSFEAPVVYQSVLEGAMQLGFKQLEINPQALEWIKGQRSGTCAWKVLIAYLKTHPLAEVIHPLALRFDLKRYSLEDYYNTNIRRNRMHEMAVLHQLRFALQNCARMIHKFKSKHESLNEPMNKPKIESKTEQEKISPVSKKALNDFLKKIQEIESAVSLQQKGIQQLHSDLLQYWLPNGESNYAKLTQPIQSAKTFVHNDIMAKSVCNMDFSSTKLNDILPPQFIEFEYNNFAKEPIKLLTEALTIAQKNHEQNHYLSIIQLIEKLYPVLFSQKIIENAASTKELHEILHHIAALNALYATACAKQDLKPFAENLTTLYCGLSVTFRTIEKYFSNPEIFKCLIQTLVPHIWGMTQHIESAHFITCNPNKNRIMRECYSHRKELETLKKPQSPFRSGIHALLASDPKTLREINKLADEDEKFKKLLEEKGYKFVPIIEKAVFYYLDNRKQFLVNPEFNEFNRHIDATTHLMQILTELGHFCEGKLDLFYTLRTPEDILKEFPQKGNYYFTNMNSGEIICWVSSNGFPNKMYNDSTQSFTLTSTQPAISDKEINLQLGNSNILFNRPKSNIIQMSDKQGTLTERSALLRTLANIRIDSNTQVTATIDFMKKEFTRLINKDIQTFVFINLFQFDFLDNQIQVTPMVVDELAALLDKGFKVNINAKNIKEPGFFFLKCATALREILHLLNHDNKAIHEVFATLDNILSDYIGFFSSRKNEPTALAKLSQLHNLRLWNLKFQLKDKKELGVNDVKNVLGHIIFRYNFADFYTQDPFVEIKVRNAIADFIPFLQSYFSAVVNKEQDERCLILNEILGGTGISFKLEDKASWQNHFPVMKYIGNLDQQEKCQVNILTGQVFLEGHRIVSLPREVTSHPLFTSFFDEKVLKAKASPTQKSFEFSIKGENYRFNLYNNTAILQKELLFEGQKRWFQYDPETLASLPLTLRQLGMQTWVTVEPHAKGGQIFVLLNPLISNKILSCYSLNSKVAYRFVDENALLIHHLTNDKASMWLAQYSFLTQFEDPAFIEFWQPIKPSQTKLFIRLPRYDIELEEVEVKGKSEYIFKQDKRYKIDLSARPIIPGFASALVLTPCLEEKNEKKQNQEIQASQDKKEYQDKIEMQHKVEKESKVEERLNRLLLIPKQEFMAVKNVADHEYYQYEFDTKNEIIKRRLRLKKKFSKEECEDPKYFPMTGQEKLITYKLSHQDEILPESLADRIYLAYLYLAKRHPLLAFQTLKSILNEPYQLGVGEIEDLRKIIQELPAKVSLDAAEAYFEEKAHIVAPEYIAVRLLAITILTIQHIRHEPIDFKLEFSNNIKRITQLKPNIRIANLEAESLVYDKTKEFFLDKQAYYHCLNRSYQDYLGTENNIPISMRLSKEHELIVLKWMTKLKNKINEKYPSLIALPMHFKARRRTIEKFLNPSSKPVHLTPKQSMLAPKTVQIKFEQIFGMLAKSKKALLCQETALRGAKKLRVIDWHLDTNEKDFLYTFFDFVTILQNSVHSDRPALEKRINEHLMFVAYKQDRGAKTSGIIDNLVILLGYCLDFPEILNDLKDVKDLSNAFKLLIGKLEQIDKLQKKNPASSGLSGLARTIMTLKPVPIKDQPKIIFTIVQGQVKKPNEKNLQEKNSVEKHLLKVSADLSLEFSDLYQKDIENELVQQVGSLQVKSKMLEPLFQDTKAHESKTIADRLLIEIEQDYQAGVQENQKMWAQRKAIEKLYNDKIKNDPQGFSQWLTKEITSRNNRIEQFQKTILSLANQPPKDELRATVRSCELSGQKRFPLTMANLYHLYLMQETTLYVEQTALNDQEIQQLNDLMFQYLLESTALQRYQRIETAYKKLQEETLVDKDMHEIYLLELGQWLSSKRCFDAMAYPTLLLFEFLENKQLYPKQFEYINALIKTDKTSFISQSIQLIMGGGKSKVLLPLLAQLKSEGIHLPIIEVPQSLFNVNLIDLNATTQRLFGKRAIPFQFDDRTPNSAEYLKSLLDRLKRAIANREYMVSSKESLQSFELKYLKLLRFGNIREPNIAKRLKYSHEILMLFRAAPILIDEVDSTLDVRKQLIHTVGKGDPIPQHEIKDILDLFEFFVHIQIEDIMQSKMPMSVQTIVEERCNPGDEQWLQILQRIAESLLNHPKSPLLAVKSQVLDVKSQEELKLYLLGKSSTIPSFIGQCSARDRDKIALYKEELSNLLKMCLQKRVDEHIGLSRDHKKHGFEREIAIPYIANNVPNETARFGHYLETLNYTVKIQGMKSLSESVVQAFFKGFLELAKEALGPHGSMAAYEKIIKRFASLTQCHLNSIDIDEPEEFLQFYQKVKNNPLVKRYCLRHHILNYVDKNARTLRSDAQNHASQFRSIQGMTGTNWNYRCHPPGMKANLLASHGSDGQTIDHLLTYPQKPILLMNSESNSKLLINAAFAAANKDNIEKIRAWIDLGASFKGVSNKEVAHQFAEYFAAKSTLHYILYFGENNHLYALKSGNNSRNQMPILLKSSDRDYIQQRLQCSPAQCFTYYDQVHCTGTDIAQAKDAHALVTVGLKTLERDLLQAVMRMRELKGNQRITFVISKELQEAHPEILPTDWNAKSILKICVENQITRLTDDHFRSTIQKIRNSLRNHLLECILHAKTLDEKHKLSQAFEEVFFTNVSKSAFDQFKHVTSLEKTNIVLRNIVEGVQKSAIEGTQKLGNSHQNEIISNTNTGEFIEEGVMGQLQRLMKKAGISISSKEVNDFRTKLNAIVEEALPICPLQVMQPVISTSLLDTEVSVEREEENEQQKTLETELDQSTRLDAAPLEIKKWLRLNLNAFNLEPDAGHGGVALYSLEFMTNTHGKKRNWKFSPNILVSENFMNTCESQPNKLDAYKKDNIFVLMLQDNKFNTLKALLLTPEEAAQFKEKIKDYEDQTRYFWIESVHQTRLIGKKPASSDLHPSYTAIIEQISLFNGDTDILCKESNWLLSEEEQVQAKLDFAARIMPLHKDKIDLLWLLKQKVETMAKKGEDNQESQQALGFPPSRE